MAEVLTSPPAAEDPHCFIDLEDRVAVYDRRSGRTHLLDPLTAEVLRLSAAASGSSVESLRETLLARLDVSTAELPPSLVEDALAQLRSAGLVV